MQDPFELMPDEEETPLFQAVQVRVLADGKYVYAWGVRHSSGTWYPMRFDGAKAALAMVEALTRDWAEGREGVLVWDFENLR